MASGGSGRPSGSRSGSRPGSASRSSSGSTSGSTRPGRDGGGARNGQRGGGSPSGKGAGQRTGQRPDAKRGPNPVTRGKRPSTATRRQVPWLLIGAVTVIVVLAVGVIGFALMREGEVSAWRPSDDNRDPSLAIPGIVTGQYAGQQHVTAEQRVAYDRSPPFGGPHDAYWAACNGVVYPTPVRTENMVHSLEHGAVWIAYDPARITGPAVQTLAARVQGQDYTMMSPYPGLDQPIALMSWGHELKLSDPNDPRIDQFISSLRQNQYQYPEVGASCDALGPGYFDPDNPPPFDASPLPPDAVTMDGRGAAAGAGG
ncbi:DUF3105 domain-containing protein [Actinomycetospora cinnamomea]|uniref:DUF3105 domain-containing protein n=1 Tax=Actinomycetospora cinnamomea TaxID=663609 RepID=UPI000E32481F